MALLLLLLVLFVPGVREFLFKMVRAYALLMLVVFVGIAVRGWLS